MIDVPLTDADWSRIAYLFPVLPAVSRGRPRSHPRALLNGILWVLINRQQWRCLPATFPPQQTCYNPWLQWKRIGIMELVSAEFGLDAI
jgi:transposase